MNVDTNARSHWRHIIFMRHPLSRLYLLLLGWWSSRHGFHLQPKKASRCNRWWPPPSMRELPEARDCKGTASLHVVVALLLPLRFSGYRIGHRPRDNGTRRAGAWKFKTEARAICSPLFSNTSDYFKVLKNRKHNFRGSQWYWYVLQTCKILIRTTLYSRLQKNNKNRQIK
jgi:hypothetical protein